MKTGLEKAIEVASGLTRLAERLGESPQTVNNWRSRSVPAEHCPNIERITRELGNPVYCEELRPDIEWQVLRKTPRLHASRS